MTQITNLSTIFVLKTLVLKNVKNNYVLCNFFKIQKIFYYAIVSKSIK